MEADSSRLKVTLNTHKDVFEGVWLNLGDNLNTPYAGLDNKRGCRVKVDKCWSNAKDPLVSEGTVVFLPSQSEQILQM